MSNKFVDIILLLVVVALIVWDLFLFGDDKLGNTISARLYKSSVEYIGPALPYAWGFLTGHLFLSFGFVFPWWLWLATAFVPISFLVLIHQHNVAVSGWLVLSIGSLMGATFWANLGDKGA